MAEQRMELGFSLRRFEDTFQELEREPVQAGGTLLYGSSFFRNWGYTRAHEQLLEASGGRLDCRNHGFGGATADELLYAYPRLVRPYAPKALVLRFGLNDIARGFSPEETWLLTLRLILWAKTDFPDVKLALLGVFDTRKLTDAQTQACRVFNDYQRAYCAAHDVLYVDLNGFFYETPADIGSRKNFRPVFIEDGLHLTDEGYGQMAGYLAEKLRPLQD